MRGRLRLTWLELGIVVVTLAVGTTVAGADLAARRIRANEASAVATLRLIVEAQEQFKALAVVDVDVDRLGEYGTFREIAGDIAARTDLAGINYLGSKLDPPLLPRRFRRLNQHAEARDGGYRFKVFLPGAWGAGVEERPTGARDSLSGTVDADNSETTWCGYAWPSRFGVTGSRTFFVNQSGVVTSTSARRYTGSGRIDSRIAGAAFVAGEGWIGAITGTQALGTVGRDGNFWKVVE